MEMVRVLVRDPYVRDRRGHLGVPRRRGEQRPGLVERLAREPRIRPDDGPIALDDDGSVGDEADLHERPDRARPTGPGRWLGVTSGVSKKSRSAGHDLAPSFNSTIVMRPVPRRRTPRTASKKAGGVVTPVLRSGYARLALIITLVKAERIPSITTCPKHSPIAEGGHQGSEGSVRSM